MFILRKKVILYDAFRVPTDLNLKRMFFINFSHGFASSRPKPLHVANNVYIIVKDTKLEDCVDRRFLAGNRLGDEYNL